MNDTQYALESLMSNGIAYSANMVQNTIGGATLSSFVSQLTQQAQTQNLQLSISNNSIIVFQTAPYSLNISYSGFAVINSIGGSIAYPLSFNTSLNLQSTPDLYGAFTALQGPFQYPTGYKPGALQPVTVPAQFGSRSPYMFASGPLFFDPSATANCKDPYISNEVSITANAVGQYILVAPYSANIPSAPSGTSNTICGFGGLLTYTPNSIAPLKPYLVYNPLSNAIGYNGFGYPNSGNFVFTLPQSRYLLDGNSLTLEDTTQLESTIQNQYYVASGYAPSYLQLSSGSLNTMSPYGVAPLGTLERQVGTFNQNEIIIMSNVPLNLQASGFDTVSFWMQISNSIVPTVPFSFISQPSTSSTYTVAINSANVIGISPGVNPGYPFTPVSMLGVPTQTKQYISNMQWVHVAAVFYNGAPSLSNVQLYLNGIRQNLQVIGSPPSSFVTNTLAVGEEFYGQIADVQLYNTILTPYQIYSLYSQGINAPPFAFTNLAGWWPLNGNMNDYSQYKNNGTVTVVSGTRAPSFQTIGGYAADTMTGGGSYFNPPNRISGVSHCYSITNCSYGAPGQLYVRLPSGYSSNSVEKPQSSLGLLNSTMPGVAVFDNSQDSMITASNIVFGSSPSFISSACGTMPPSIQSLIVNCVSINIVNTQGTATPANFPQMLPNLPFNALAGNVVVYNSISGALMPSWVESNSVVWVNLEANTIPALSSANGIYYFGIGASGTNFFTSTTPANQIGEAPQYSCNNPANTMSGCTPGQYGKYDNGAKVFSAYQNFAGTSFPASWGSVVVPGAGKYYVANGIRVVGGIPPNEANLQIFPTSQSPAPASYAETS